MPPAPIERDDARAAPSARTTSTTLGVLLVTHGYPPESVGGVEQHVSGLANALAAQGQDVRIYTRTARPELPQGTLVHEAEGPWPVTRVAYRHEGLGSLAELYRCELLDRAFERFLSPLLRAHSIDVAHVHHFTGLSTGLARILRAHGVPVVLTLHDYWLLCPRGQMWSRDRVRCEDVEPHRCAACLSYPFGGLLPAGQEAQAVAALHAAARELLLAVDALVVPSPRAIAPFVRLGVPPERIQVVENGVDTQALAGLPSLAPPRPRPPTPLAPPAARSPAPAPTALRVGYLGTLIPSKGLDVLVDAVLRLPPDSIELHVHGNVVPYHGDEGFLTRTFARLHAGGPRVVYHGPYQAAELPAILAGLDVVAAPALWHEAYGLTVREALAAARPVVVSRVGGLQDAIQDGVQGTIVPPGDPAALAAALHALATDRDLLWRMSAAARAGVNGGARGFAAMAADLVDLYGRLVRSRRHPAAQP